MLERWVDEIQKAYDKNRAPETWGTQQVSPFFFGLLRSEGFLAAWNYLVNKERTMGNPSAPPQIKAVANLTASLLLVLGVREMSGRSDEVPGNARKSSFRKIKELWGRALFNMTLGLLFFAQGGTTHMGYLGRDPSEWSEIYVADLTPDEQKIVEREFNPEIDGCQMDTIARIFPEKLKKYSENRT